MSDAGVAPFYKQGGASNRCPHDAKGEHPDCFPDDLRVREWPYPRADASQDIPATSHRDKEGG